MSTAFNDIACTRAILELVDLSMNISLMKYTLSPVMSPVCSRCTMMDQHSKVGYCHDGFCRLVNQVDVLLFNYFHLDAP